MRWLGPVRAAGDPLGRTLAQLRSDVALDLVLYGEVAPGRVTDADSPLRLVGAFPPARVNLVVGLSTLLGQDDGLGELPGHGYLAAAHAREVATTDGSRWRWLVTDAASGRLVELSTRSYRPTEAIRRHVLAHDAVCRAPGCTVPAATCDVDHERPFPSGRTSTANLSAKHRRHHALKTTGLWTSRGDPLTGTLTWRTFAGRTYVTHPHDYRELSEPRTGDVAVRGWPRGCRGRVPRVSLPAEAAGRSRSSECAVPKDPTRPSCAGSPPTRPRVRDVDPRDPGGVPTRQPRPVTDAAVGAAAVRPVRSRRHRNRRRGRLEHDRPDWTPGDAIWWRGPARADPHLHRVSTHG